MLVHTSMLKEYFFFQAQVQHSCRMFAAIFILRNPMTRAFIMPCCFTQLSIPFSNCLWASYWYAYFKITSKNIWLLCFQHVMYVLLVQYQLVLITYINFLLNLDSSSYLAGCVLYDINTNVKFFTYRIKFLEYNTKVECDSQPFCYTTSFTIKETIQYDLQPFCYYFLYINTVVNVQHTILTCITFSADYFPIHTDTTINLILVMFCFHPFFVLLLFFLHFSRLFSYTSKKIQHRKW